MRNRTRNMGRSKMHLTVDDWKFITWGILLTAGLLFCWAVFNGRLEFLLGIR